MANYRIDPRYHNPYYRAWRWMRNVCFNKRTPGYQYCGAQGITCYWDQKGDYQDFFSWIMKKLGPRPDGMVLGRKDKTGDFAPGNLCWETPKQRGRHSPGQNITATYRRKTQSLADWADELEIPYYTLRRRYNQGWTIKEIANHYRT